MTREEFEKLSTEKQEKLKDKFMKIYPKFRWVWFDKWLQYENKVTEESKEEV
jgi:hypothetical protein